MVPDRRLSPDFQGDVPRRRQSSAAEICRVDPCARPVDPSRLQEAADGRSANVDGITQPAVWGSPTGEGPESC